MQVPNERIEEFIDLWERAFGERITQDQARTRAHQLVELHRVIRRELPPGNSEASSPPPAAGEREPKNSPGGGSNRQNSLSN